MRFRRAVAACLLLTTGWVGATVAPAAAAEPPVDGYQDYVDPGCLSFVEQPGVKDFRDMIRSRVGGGNGGIHACSGYEHGEGRAWDWMMNAGNGGQAAKVQQVLDWLLRPDAAGNAHAMARRLGIGNIIWNRRSISLWNGRSREWNDYACDGTPGDCHTNHVHFAFSWPGAARETTWFTTADKPGSWYPDGAGDPSPPSPPVDDASVQFADLNADGRDEIITVTPEGNVIAYRNRGWDADKVYDGSDHKQVASGFDVSRTRFADLNGDGRDEIITVTPEGNVIAYRNRGWDADKVYDGSDYKQVASGFEASRTRFGDLNADGRDEIITVTPDGKVIAYRNRGWDADKVYDGPDYKQVASGFHIND